MIADLKARKLKPIPLSGQDASPQGVQYILAGWQTGTVYKYVPDEAKAAAAAAVALLKGKKPKSNTTRKNGSKSEPTLALPVVWITKANYKRLFTDKFLKRSDVCIGEYKKYCKLVEPSSVGAPCWRPHRRSVVGNASPWPRPRSFNSAASRSRSARSRR